MHCGRLLHLLHLPRRVRLRLPQLGLLRGLGQLVQLLLVRRLLVEQRGLRCRRSHRVRLVARGGRAQSLLETV